MASLNKVFLMGNLTQDPDLRTIPTGQKVCDMHLAVNERWMDKATGQARDIVCYVDVVVWRSAENCAKYLKKGSPVFVEGRLQMDQWTTKEGEKRSKLRVRADSVQFLSAGPRRDNAPAQTQPSAASNTGSTGASEPNASYQTPLASDASAPLGGDEEDLPF